MNRKLLLLLACLGLAASAAAQTGKLTGTLTPPAGGKISGESIVLTNVDNGMARRIDVNPDGSFSASLEPGTYKVEVEMNGQRQTAAQNLVITPSSNSQITIPIEPGNGTLEIQAQAPAGQDEPPDLGRGYPTRTVRELPVFDRNYQELNGLPSGTVPPVVSSSITQDPQRGRIVNTNGLPAFVNDSLDDGTTVRDPVTQTLAVRIVPDEAVDQLNVHTTNYPADTGFAAGQVSNVFVRPGTNAVHGSLFGFWSNDRFAANDPVVPAGVGEPTLHHSQYGGTIGGALAPDKLFLFLSYQGSHDDGSGPQFATVPTQPMLGGDFSGLGTTLYNPLTGVTTGAAAGTGRLPFSGNLIPLTSINPLSAAILIALPAANLPGFANNLAGEVPQSIDSNTGDGKLDYRFSDALTGFLSFGISNFDSRQDSLFGPVVGGPARAGLRNDHAAVSLVGNYRGILAELRFGYSRYRNQITSLAQAGALGPELAAAGFSGSILPPITIEGLGTLGTAAGVPSRDVDNIYDGSANFHVFRGAHQFTFGVNVRAEQSDGWLDQFLGPFGPYGGFTFGPGATMLAGAGPGGINSAFAGSLASFLLGAPTTGGIFTPSGLPSFRQNQYSAYISDIAHLGSRFTIDLGVRYDVFSPVTARRTAQAAFFNPIANASVTGSELNGGDYDLNNVSPRVGIALRATRHTVFRAAYSMNYFPLPFLYSGLNLAGAGASVGANGSLLATPFSLPAVPSGPTILPAGTTPVTAANIPSYFRTAFQTPYTENFYAMIQQDLPAGFLFDFGYVGNLGRQLPYLLNRNAALPGAGLAGLPFLPAGQTAPVTEIGQGVTSNYNSLQVNLTKQLSKGASIAVAYTWGKALDYGLLQLNNFDRAANYGPADWDRTQTLTISHLFALPVGIGSAHWNGGAAGQILANWELVGLFRWATGAPYSVTADPAACACPGNSAILATAVPGAGSVNGSAFPNPALFSAPGAGLFGNLGRNSFRGPDLTSYNLSLFKSFAFKETRKLEFRAEAYNLLNNIQYANPPGNISFANFGQNTATLNNMGGRTFILGARVLF